MIVPHRDLLFEIRSTSAIVSDTFLGEVNQQKAMRYLIISLDRELNASIIAMQYILTIDLSEYDMLVLSREWMGIGEWDDY